MLHDEALTASFQHHYRITKVFRDFLGLYDIEHFSLDLVSPDNKMIFLSSTPSHCFEICKRGYGPYDGIISPEYYQNYEFYWWKNASHKAYAGRIDAIREGILGMKNGFMLVRKWDDFYLIYSFAAKKSNNDFLSTVVNGINYFLQMGDYAYNELRDIYADYCKPYNPPYIEHFYPFSGGMPPERYSSNFSPKETTETSSLIKVDFNTKRIISS